MGQDRNMQVAVVLGHWLVLVCEVNDIRCKILDWKQCQIVSLN